MTVNMRPFEYNSNAARVIFGSGTVHQLPAELKRLSLVAPLLVSSAGRGVSLCQQLQSIVEDASITPAGVHPRAVMHTPIERTEEALATPAFKAADCIVSIGGGTAVGLGKALAIRSGKPHLCLPSTYAGSEMSPVLGETKSGVKTTRSDPAILPTVVIYDCDLSKTMPPALSAISGVNAIAHAVEGLYAPNSNPILDLYAIEGVRALATALPEIVEQPASSKAREEALYGAWMCSMVLGTAKMGLHHKICHVLGGSLGLPHAETHTIILPHALSYNAPQIPEQMDKLASVLPNSDGDALEGLKNLLHRLRAPTALKDYGMREEQIGEIVQTIIDGGCVNPRELDRQALTTLLQRAWAGDAPKADF